MWPLLNLSFNCVTFCTAEILFPDRPGSSSGNPLGTPASNLHDSAGNPASRQLLANELGEPMMLNHKSLTDSINDNVQPLGLLWSELEGAHLKRSNLSGTLSGVGDRSWDEKSVKGLQ